MIYMNKQMKLHCLKMSPGLIHILNKRYECNQIYNLSVYCVF